MRVIIRSKPTHDIIPASSKTACEPWVQYANDVTNILFLDRLEFLPKTGCIPHSVWAQRGHIHIFSPKSQSQILNYQILNICRVLQHYMHHIEISKPHRMYTPEFHSYHTVILLSDLDFVAITNEHVLLMSSHQTRVYICRDGSIILIVWPAQ